MILTDKAKKQFLEWVNLNHKDDFYYIESNLILVNALIIEWLDNVGVYVNALRYNGKYWKAIANHELDKKHKTRPEATTEAIKRANEIINLNQ